MIPNPPDAILFRCRLCGRTQLGVFVGADTIHAIDRVKRAMRIHNEKMLSWHPKACQHRGTDVISAVGAGPIEWRKGDFEILEIPRNALALLQTL